MAIEYLRARRASQSSYLLWPGLACFEGLVLFDKQTARSSIIIVPPHPTLGKSFRSFTSTINGGLSHRTHTF
jgi:hypothetical protein